LNDPDAGTTTSMYDAFGNLLREVTAGGDTTTFAYNGLGRITHKSDVGSGIKYGLGAAGPHTHTWVETIA
jgi:YD repeat-containing protein